MKNKEKKYLPFVEIFDTALAKDEGREFKPRGYCYASELTMSFYNRYLSMKGVLPTNLPNEIALRKFKMGAALEDFFKLVLYEVGLLHAQEERIMSNFKSGLQVSGRIDVLYGGKFDMQNIGAVLGKLSFLSFIGVLSKAMYEFAEINKGVRYDICGLEIKSMSDIMFNKIVSRGKPEIHHAIQTFHYAFWKKMPFQLVYFDKNNGRMMSFWIMPDDKELYAIYMKDIAQMTHYYENSITPPKELLLSFDGNRFSHNWGVLYSNYLTGEYGFPSKEAYKAHTDPLMGRWNRVMVKIKEGKELTPDNILAIKDMKAQGYDVDVPDTIDVVHEIVEANEPERKESSLSALDRIKNILGQFPSS